MIKKIISTILTAACILAACVFPVCASETEDLPYASLPNTTVTTNTVTITLEAADDDPVEGAEISMWQVAKFVGYTVSDDEDNPTYDLPYAALTEYNWEDDIYYASITAEELLELAEYMADVIDSDGIEADASGTTDENGQVTLEYDDYGLFLVMQTNEVNGYEVITPFILQLPLYEDGEWLYTPEVYPKVSVAGETESESETETETAISASGTSGTNSTSGTSGGSSETETSYDGVPTGDTTNLITWIVVFIVAVIGLAVVFIMYFKKRRK